MQAHTLHQYRKSSTVLKYALVLSAVLLILMGNITARHDSSHIVKADQHCVLCLTSHNLDHAVLFNAFKSNVLAQTFIQQFKAQQHVIASLPLTFGNRDPPQFN